MKPVSYHAPTAIYSGSHCVEENKGVLLGCTRQFEKVFIVTSPFQGGCRNLALEDVQALFDANGIAYEIYSDVEENPYVETIVKVTDMVRAFHPDALVGIGGGSALDVVKAVNLLLTYPEGTDAYEAFYYSGERCAHTTNRFALPSFAIPTTAGSGSDVMGFAILSRTDTHTKLRINQMSYFKACFLDAKYIEQSPMWLLDTGVMDALSHGIETVLNTRCTIFAKMWAHMGFELFAQFKDHLLTQTFTEDDYNTMLLAASVLGIGQLATGTTIPHGLGYSLTGAKGVSHGLANMMVMPAFLRSFKNQAPVEDMLHRCGFADLNEFDVYIQAIIDRNVDITVTPEELTEWAETCSKLPARVNGHIEPIDAAGIEAVLQDGLRKYMR